MNEDKAKMVLRYYIPLENHEERFKLLVNFLERTGIKRVILFTGSFAEESAFCTMEYYRNHAHMLSGYVPILKSLGVETGINMLTTMGHIFYAQDGEFDFKRARDMDGKPAMGWACLTDTELLEYIREQYSYYAALKPSAIFLDDDVRHIKMGGLSCFCDEHISRVSKKVGKNLSREQIKKEILSAFVEGNAVKKAFMDMLKEDVDSLTCMIEETVHKISPETRIGIMTVDFPTVTFDRDLGDFFHKYASKKIDLIRTGMNFYREGEIKEIPLEFANPMIQRNFINNDAVEIQPEIENDTYTLFYKSKTVTNLQTVWCLTNGLRNMQLNLFDYMDLPVSDFDEYTNLYAEKMKYYNAITGLIPEGSKSSGVGIYKNSRSLLYRRVKKENSIDEFICRNYWYQWLGLDGLPIGYNWDKTEWIFLTGDDISGADKDTVESFLSRGALIDIRAAECLFKMGYGERIGVREISPIGKEIAGERFLDDPLNSEFCGFHNSYYFHSGLVGPEDAKQVEYLPGAREISKVINHHKEKVANGLTLYENKASERFCIFPIDAGVFQQFMNVNYKRKLQLINVFEWIARKPLPVVSLHANVAVNINEFPGRNVITLFNLTTDTLPEIKLKYAAENQIYALNASGALEKADTYMSGDVLNVKRDICPLGCLVLVEDI